MNANRLVRILLETQVDPKQVWKELLATYPNAKPENIRNLKMALRYLHDKFVDERMSGHNFITGEPPLSREEAEASWYTRRMWSLSPFESALNRLANDPDCGWQCGSNLAGDEVDPEKRMQKRIGHGNEDALRIYEPKPPEAPDKILRPRFNEPE